MSKKAVLAIGVIIFLGIGFSWVRARKVKRERISIVKVKKKTLQKIVSASGKVKSEKEIELKFQTSGQLAWVGVKEGDWVKRGQAIAQLDTHELQKKLQKALKDYMKERWDFEQERENYGITTDNLDSYTLSNEVRRILEKNQFDLDKAVLDVELKDIALKYATLISPISGIVTHIDTPVSGVNITPATAVFTIADPSSVVFEANIDEVDIGQIKLGQKAIVTLDAYPKNKIETKVEKIGFSSTTTRGGGTAFPVKFTLPENKDLRFKLGMNGDVEIIVEEKKDALTVPSSSVRKRGGKYYVFAIQNGVVRKKEVKIGLETEEEIEILEGLSENEEVVAKNISKIKEGERVR